MSDSFDDSLNSSTDPANDHQPWKAVFDNALMVRQTSRPKLNVTVATGCHVDAIITHSPRKLKTGLFYEVVNNCKK